MPLPVTTCTQCDQVVQCVVTEFTSLNLMMYLQVFRRTATLTTPPISFEREVTKGLVFLKTQLQSRSSLAEFLHRLLRLGPRAAVLGLAIFEVCTC